MKDQVEYLNCGICNKNKKDSAECKIGVLRTKNDFENIFNISQDPWGHEKFNKWELKSIKEIRELIKRNISMKNLKILDVGIATGEKDYDILKEFKSSNNFYFVDISSRALAKAKQLIKFGEFIESDINNGLDFDNCYFDLVLLLEIIYYLDLKKVIPELERLIKKKGYLILDITLKDDVHKYNAQELFKLLLARFSLLDSKYIECDNCKRNRGFFIFQKN